jgi:hypothetical protein
MDAETLINTIIRKKQLWLSVGVPVTHVVIGLEYFNLLKDSLYREYVERPNMIGEIGKDYIVLAGLVVIWSNGLKHEIIIG